jgi:hypothetical protein
MLCVSAPLTETFTLLRYNRVYLWVYISMLALQFLVSLFILFPWKNLQFPFLEMEVGSIEEGGEGGREGGGYGLGSVFWSVPINFAYLQFWILKFLKRE